jgi:hypothetical protein
MPPKLNLTDEEKRLRRNEQSRLAKAKKREDAKPIAVEGDLEIAPKKKGGARVKEATAGLTEAEKKARRNEQSRLSKQKRKVEKVEEKFAENYGAFLPEAKAIKEKIVTKKQAKEAKKTIPLTEKLKKQQEIIAKYPPLPKADLSTLSEADKKARRNEQSRRSKAKAAELKALEEAENIDLGDLLDISSPSPPSTPPEVRKREKARVAKATQREKAKAEPKMKQAGKQPTPPVALQQETLQSITQRIAEIKAVKPQNIPQSLAQADAIERELAKLDAIMANSNEMSSARVMPSKKVSKAPPSVLPPKAKVKPVFREEDYEVVRLNKPKTPIPNIQLTIEENTPFYAPSPSPLPTPKLQRTIVSIGKKGDDLLEEGEITPRGKHYWDGSKRIPLDKPQTPKAVQEYEVVKKPKTPPTPKVIEKVRYVEKVIRQPKQSYATNNPQLQAHIQNMRTSNPYKQEPVDVSNPYLQAQLVLMKPSTAPITERLKAKLERTRHIFNSDVSTLDDVRKAFALLTEDERSKEITLEFHKAVERARERYADEREEEEFNRTEFLRDLQRPSATKEQLRWAMSDDDEQQVVKSTLTRNSNEVSSAKIMPSQLRPPSPDYSPPPSPATPINERFSIARSPRIIEPLVPPSPEDSRMIDMLAREYATRRGGEDIEAGINEYKQYLNRYKTRRYYPNPNEDLMRAPNRFRTANPMPTYVPNSPSPIYVPNSPSPTYVPNSPSPAYVSPSPRFSPRSPDLPPPKSVEAKIQNLSSEDLEQFDYDTLYLEAAITELNKAVSFPDGNTIIERVESSFKTEVNKYSEQIQYTVNRNTELLKAYWDALDKAKSRVSADHLKQLREDTEKKRRMPTPEGYERDMFGDFEKIDRTPSRKPSPAESPKMTQEEIEAMFAEYSEEEEEDGDEEDYFEKYGATGNGMGRKLKILELFKGTGSVGKAARRRGMDVRSLDFLEKYKPDILADMLTWDYKKWAGEGWVPDLIWASPPCNTFSPLAYPLKERNTKTATPYSARAKQGTQILYRTLEAIKFFKSKNPNLLFVIENPRGMMRMDAKMKQIPMETTTYCAYGDFKRKPTDFWNNLPNGLTLKPLGPCPNPEKIIRVDKLKTIEERYSIPQRLMTKLLTEMATQYGQKPRNVIGGMMMNAKKGGYWDFDEDNNSIVGGMMRDEEEDFKEEIRRYEELLTGTVRRLAMAEMRDNTKNFTDIKTRLHRLMMEPRFVGNRFAINTPIDYNAPRLGEIEENVATLEDIRRELDDRIAGRTPLHLLPDGSDDAELNLVRVEDDEDEGYSSPSERASKKSKMGGSGITGRGAGAATQNPQPPMTLDSLIAKLISNNPPIHPQDGRGVLLEKLASKLKLFQKKIKDLQAYVDEGVAPFDAYTMLSDYKRLESEVKQFMGVDFEDMNLDFEAVANEEEYMNNVDNYGERTRDEYDSNSSDSNSDSSGGMIGSGNSNKVAPAPNMINPNYQKPIKTAMDKLIFEREVIKKAMKDERENPTGYEGEFDKYFKHKLIAIENLIALEEGRLKREARVKAEINRVAPAPMREKPLQIQPSMVIPQSKARSRTKSSKVEPIDTDIFNVNLDDSGSDKMSNSSSKDSLGSRSSQDDDYEIEGAGSSGTKSKFLDFIVNAGTELGKPFKKKVGINPFTLGMEFGEKVVAPALFKIIPPKGKGLKKGSAEAKAWGEKMRAMRGKGKSQKVIESKKPCCKMCSGSGCYCCR